MGVIMLDDMENLKILSVFHKKSKPFGDVKSRSVSCFAVRVSGTMRYIFGDKEFVVNPGEMIFLKKGDKMIPSKANGHRKTRKEDALWKPIPRHRRESPAAQ
jgi:hypothetical protein